MPDVPTQPTPLERGVTEIEAVRRHLARVCGELDRQLIPGELAGVRFDGKSGEFEFVDDHGSPALSYAVYNTSDIPVFVAFGGGPASAAGGALEVPARYLVVFPISTLGHVRLGVDAGELGEDQLQLQRVRFHTVQPFFAGAL